MATRYIAKAYGVNPTTAIANDATGRLKVQNLPSATGLVYDSVSNTFKYNANGTIKTLADDGTSTTTVNIGAPSGATVSAVETGNGTQHKTVLTLTALPLTLVNADGLNGKGVKIYDFPLGSITILGSVGHVAETTTSAILTTLNGGVTYNWGVGSTTQVNAVLATTEQDIQTKANGVSSTVINVAAAASTGALAGGAVGLNGTGTAIDAFFNVGVAADGDIDGDATTLWTGVITITWLFNGVS